MIAIFTENGLLPVMEANSHIKLLKPTDYVMHLQFNLLKPTCYVMHRQV